MLSVVIPLYNKAQSIKSTIESVLNQTYTDFEIVVVDDGSTDDSANMVDGIKDDRIRLIHKENGGVSSARNEGILASKGEYVAFLDGDDLWDNTYLETLADLINDYPDATIYGIGYGWINNGKRIIAKYDYPDGYRGYVNDVWNNYPGYLTGSSSSSSKENLIKAGLFDARMTHGEDIDMWWRLLLIGRCAVDVTPLAWYCKDAENRAMNRLIPLEQHIPYYIDKFEEARTNNKAFCKYFDTEMLYRIYPYLFDKKYKAEAKRLAIKLDFTQLKWSARFRVEWPYLYKLYESLKKIHV